MVLPFQILCKEHYMPFVSGIFHLEKYLKHTGCCLYQRSTFFLPSGISLYGCTSVFLIQPLVMGIYVVSSFWRFISFSFLVLISRQEIKTAIVTHSHKPLFMSTVFIFPCFFLCVLHGNTTKTHILPSFINCIFLKWLHFIESL